MIGTTLSGRYRLESKLGSGGMSTVYLAHDETLEREVAVKILHREISDQPDQIARFSREARTVAQLSHPNVVAVIDAGEDGGHPYIVFEYVSGETLKQRINRTGRLPLDEAAAYAIEIARGLSAAHSRRLIHRDVKPQNVLIDEEGRARVTDFGIARELEAEGLTATGRVLGTTDYVSPEQAMGQDVDARSDIYSLGIVLYEMLTGRVPFTAETVVGVAMKHVNEQVPDVQRRRPQTSSALAAVVERSTAKDPDRRYRDMGAMLDDLEDALQVEVARAGASSGEATTVLDQVSRRRLLTRRRASRVGAVGVVIAVAAVTLAIVGLTGHSGTPDGISKANRLGLVAAHDFDPIGGDGEHPEDVGLAHDNQPVGTAWTTETYNTQENFKPGGANGVGLYVDAGQPVNAKGMEVRSQVPGWSFEVYGANGSRAPDGGPSDPLGGWERLGEVSNASTHQVVELRTTSSSYRFYLIWITKLAPGNRVEISDVRLYS